MTVLERIRLWRRKRIMIRYEKYLNSSDMIIAPRPQRIWYPHWLRGDYTLRNSELIFAAVSRISNAFSAMPIQLYKGAKPVFDDLNDLISFHPSGAYNLLG